MLLELFAIQFNLHFIIIQYEYFYPGKFNSTNEKGGLQQQQQHQQLSSNSSEKTIGSHDDLFMCDLA